MGVRLFSDKRKPYVWVPASLLYFFDTDCVTHIGFEGIFIGLWEKQLWYFLPYCDIWGTPKGRVGKCSVNAFLDFSILAVRGSIPAIAIAIPNFCRFLYYLQKNGVTRWRSWLRHCVTSHKVAGSIPDGDHWDLLLT